MKVKPSVFHAACKAIVLSSGSDDHARALAQVGLGMWEPWHIAEQCRLLLPNATHMPSEVRSALRRFSQWD